MDRLGGAAAGVPGRMEVYKPSSGPIKLKDDVREKANELFQEMKERVLQKINVDRCERIGSVDRFAVTVNLSTGAIVVYTRDGEEPITLDVVNMSDLGSDEPNVSKDLLRSIEALKNYLRQEEVISAGAYEVSDRDFEANRMLFIGSPTGVDGFQKLSVRLAPREKQVLETKDDGALSVLTGVLDQGDIGDEFERAFNESDRAMRLLSDIGRVLRDLKGRLEEDKEDEDDPEILAQIDEKIAAVDQEIREFRQVVEYKNALHLAACCSRLDEDLEPQERAESLYERLLEYFRGTEVMGSSQLNPDTGVAEIILTKKHRDLAALIAGTAVFSRNDGTHRGNLEFHRANKFGFHTFCQKHSLYPEEMHLGKIGIMIRLLNTSSEESWQKQANLETLVETTKIFERESEDADELMERLVAMHAPIVDAEPLEEERAEGALVPLHRVLRARRQQGGDVPAAAAAADDDDDAYGSDSDAEEE